MSSSDQNGDAPGKSPAPTESPEPRSTDIHTTLASALPEAARAVIEEAHRARIEAKARAAEAAAATSEPPPSSEPPSIEPAI
ncbi:MAG TPA: hypothetical protein VLT33_16520, partial [Labilithrix sp.]|nr:hypothetical protein [Labilithrix sp.]